MNYFSGESFSPSAPEKGYYNGSVNYYSHVFENAQMFPSEVLEFNNTLGKGAYGKVKICSKERIIFLSTEPQVYRGHIRYPNYKVEVAIKTCKRSNGYDDIEREARVFMKLKERNMNIVNLLGLRNNKHC